MEKEKDRWQQTQESISYRIFETTLRVTTAPFRVVIMVFREVTDVLSTSEKSFPDDDSNNEGCRTKEDVYLKEIEGKGTVYNKIYFT